MPFQLPEWAESRLRGVTPGEVDEALSARRRLALPSTSEHPQVTLIAARTHSGRPLIVAVHRVGQWQWEIIAAGELTGERLAVFQRWEEGSDEPFEG
ncbi:hypothetical protein [Nocardia harenae]|uniref:hypothetical protein n=1 Tax=Nocardia harenae TaxID=358707 RepID=UPI0012EE9AFA|nr:hypothetical protein [Nocardia harenae]